MKTDIGNYLSSYNEKLLNQLVTQGTFVEIGKAFSKSSAGALASGLKSNAYEEKVDFPWIDQLDEVTEKIMSIASNPRTHVRFDKEIRLAEQAVKVDGNDMKMTTKTSKLWRLKDEEFKPEKVYTTVYEADFAIYENRFLLNLVNKINNLLNHAIAKLNEMVKRVNKNYVGQMVSLASIDDVKDIANLDKISALTPKSEENLLLTTSDASFLDDWKMLIKAKNRINNFYSTSFYHYLKDQKPLSDSDVHITNILAEDRSYAPCYNFYLKLIKMDKVEEEKKPVDPVDYHNFVISNIFSVLADQGFMAPVDAGNKLEINANLLKCENYKVVKDEMNCFITTTDKDHIDIKFEFNYAKTAKTEADAMFTGRRASLVSIDLVSKKDEEFLNVEELSVHFRKLINQRLKKDYTNAFVITPIDGTEKDDVIICSPHCYKIDANITNMIKSCLIFAEGDTTLYAKVCPVCGAYMDGEQENGNCYCSNCGSTYSLMSQGTNEHKNELIWIKRIKNPD